MPGSAKNFGDLKKAVSWDSSLEEGSRCLASPRRDQLGSTKCAALKKLCLSLLVSKNLKLEKVNKSFVPEPISYISGFLMYISHILVDLVDPIYITNIGMCVRVCAFTCLYVSLIWTYNYAYCSYFGGACGVMVIVVGNGHGDTSSNPGRDWLHFT